jgi:hypothetical protein
MIRKNGFTLVEVLIATLISMVVLGATFTLLNPAQQTFAVQPELSDMQQRMRVAIDMLTKDLMMAGAGPYSGPMTGPLSRVFAPVLPYRLGTIGADAPGQFFSDRITLVYVPRTVAQTHTATPVASLSPLVSVSADPGCPIGDAACGIDKGMAVLVMDASGAWDTFTVSDVQGPAIQLLHRGAQLSKSYDSHAVFSQVATFTYWLKTDAAAQTTQLMRYDGNQSDVPIADNVVGLSFEYLAAPLSGALDRQPVKLSKAELMDGPWQPDAASPGRWDVDLLRVRVIRVTLRVQMANPSYRGLVPDQEITFDVAPRNLAR